MPLTVCDNFRNDCVAYALLILGRVKAPQVNAGLEIAEAKAGEIAGERLRLVCPRDGEDIVPTT